METQIFELQYAIDTFYFLVTGALVMWMAAGFAMLESGLVRAKNTAEILTKNVALYAIACFMYLATGYALGVAALFLAFFVLNKQAFANYYFFVIGALCVAVAAADASEEPWATRRRATAHAEVEPAGA